MFMRYSSIKMVGLSLVTLLLLSGCGPAKDPESGVMTLSAAMGLKSALTEIKEDYLQKHPGQEININFAASGVLRTQIEQGAPVDLFISADQKDMDELVVRGLIDTDSRTNLVGNRLVIILASDIVLDSVADGRDCLQCGCLPAVLSVRKDGFRRSGRTL